MEKLVNILKEHNDKLRQLYPDVLFYHMIHSGCPTYKARLQINRYHNNFIF